MNQEEKNIHKIAYVIHGERPLNGILETQVYSLFDRFAEKYPEFEITIFLFAHPLIFIRDFKKYRSAKKSFERKMLKIRVFPVIVIPERFELQSLLICKLSFYVNIIGYFLIPFKKYRFVCARSYVASFYCTKVEEICNIPSNIIFDPRSIYPLERYSFDFFKDKLLYPYWLEREKFIVSFSKKIISIDDGMINYFAGIENSSYNKLYKLPLSYSFTNIKEKEIEDMDVRLLPKDEGKLILLYVGSLSVGKHNNDALHYITRCSELIKLNKDFQFIFVLPDINKQIVCLFKEDPLLNKSVKFYSGKNEVLWWLKNADFGIYFMKEALDSSTRYGVKSVEYLCNGLPMIVDDGAGAIGKVIREHQFGFNIAEIKAIKNIHQVTFNKGAIIKWAKEMHSVSSNINRLYEIFSI